VFAGRITGVVVLPYDALVPYWNVYTTALPFGTIVPFNVAPLVVIEVAAPVTAAGAAACAAVAPKLPTITPTQITNNSRIGCLISLLLRSLALDAGRTVAA
jgi:hypothetical protein